MQRFYVSELSGSDILVTEDAHEAGAFVAEHGICGVLNVWVHFEEGVRVRLDRREVADYNPEDGHGFDVFLASLKTLDLYYDCCDFWYSSRECHCRGGCCEDCALWRRSHPDVDWDSGPGRAWRDLAKLAYESLTRFMVRDGLTIHGLCIRVEDLSEVPDDLEATADKVLAF